MFKPALAIVTTMCLSWGLAFAVQSLRHSTDSDIVVECQRCHGRQFISPQPLYSCRHCWRIQGAIAIVAE